MNYSTNRRDEKSKPACSDETMYFFLFNKIKKYYVTNNILQARTPQVSRCKFQGDTSCYV